MSENQNEDSDIIKVILLGESGVGKTCLYNAYFGKKFVENSIVTYVPSSKFKFFGNRKKKLFN